MSALLSPLTKGTIGTFISEIDLPRPVLRTNGSSVPRALLPTGGTFTDPDGVVTTFPATNQLWSLQTNTDGTIKLDYAKRPMLDTGAGAVSLDIGSPAAPTTRTATWYADGTMSIASWGGGPTASGGALVGRWVTVPAVNPPNTATGTTTAMPAGIYRVAAVGVGSATHFTLNDPSGTLATWTATGTATVTTREANEWADVSATGQRAYMALDAARDYVLAFPCDVWGLNPQRFPLQREFGLWTQSGHNAWASGVINHDIDYVAAAGGIGYNRLATSPNTANTGGAYHDKIMRAWRIQDHTGTFDLRGIRIGGSQLYEGFDYSNSVKHLDPGGNTTIIIGTGGLLVQDPELRQWAWEVGTAANPGRAGLYKTISGSTAVPWTSLTSQPNVGDLITRSDNTKWWRYNGGDYTSNLSYSDYGANIAPVNTNVHTGGDTLRQSSGVWDARLDTRYCKAHAAYQIKFDAWNDLPVSGGTRTVTAWNATTERVIVTAHGLAAGCPVRFASTAPAGITSGVTMFVLNPTANDFQLGALKADTSPLGITADGTGSLTLSLDPPGPASDTFLHNVLHHYSAGPWPVYLTKGNTVSSTVRVPLIADDNELVLHYTGKTLDQLVHINGQDTALATLSTDQWAVVSRLAAAAGYNVTEPGRKPWRIGRLLGTAATSSGNFDSTFGGSF